MQEGAFTERGLYHVWFWVRGEAALCMSGAGVGRAGSGGQRQGGADCAAGLEEFAAIDMRHLWLRAVVSASHIHKVS